jgi:uncharacterized protein YbcI
MEQKYFIAYVAYSTSRMDMFNDFIHIDSEINTELINDIQGSLVKRLNENDFELIDKYIGTQIVNIVKI